MQYGFARNCCRCGVSRVATCRLLHFGRQLSDVASEVLWRMAVASVASISLSRRTRQASRQLSRRVFGHGWSICAVEMAGVVGGCWRTWDCLRNGRAAAPGVVCVHRFTVATWVANFYTVVLAGGGMVRGKVSGAFCQWVDCFEWNAASGKGPPTPWGVPASGSRGPGSMSAACRGRARDGRRRIVEPACLLLLAQHRHAGGWGTENRGVVSPECGRHPRLACARPEC